MRELAALKKDLDLRNDTESRAVSEARNVKKELESMRALFAEKERQLEEAKAMGERQRGESTREDASQHHKIVHLEEALKDRERDLKNREARHRKLQDEIETLQANLRVSETKLQTS